MFDHRSDVSPVPDWLGVPKGEAMLYMFGFPLFDNSNPRSVFWDHVRHFDLDRVWTPTDRWVTDYRHRQTGRWTEDSITSTRLEICFENWDLTTRHDIIF